MTIEDVRARCLELPFVTEDSPFGPDYVTFRVAGKIFVCLPQARPTLFTAKCAPERAEALREAYAGIVPAWHWNKRHWNDVSLEADVPEALAVELIDHAYAQTLRGLPLRLRREIADGVCPGDEKKPAVAHNKAGKTPLSR